MNSAVRVLAWLVLTCFVCCIGCIYVVARDNYHCCCCIYAGELALNSLVPWMFVKHHYLLSRYVTILHSALASVIWPSATLFSDHHGLFLAIVSANRWMNSSTNVPYWVVALRVGCVLSQVIAASRDLPFEVELYTLTLTTCMITNKQNHNVVDYSSDCICLEIYLHSLM